jgi:hypothetical protein
MNLQTDQFNPYEIVKMNLQTDQFNLYGIVKDKLINISVQSLLSQVMILQTDQINLYEG